MVTVCPSQFATRRTLFHVLVGCGLLMLKVSRLKLPVIWLLRSEERFSRNAETDLVCRLLLEKEKLDKKFVKKHKLVNDGHKPHAKDGAESGGNVVERFLVDETEVRECVACDELDVCGYCRGF